MNVFLTGASSGIGLALAREFSRRGAVLGLVARRADALQALASELARRCEIYPLDVTDRERLLAAARDFERRCGPVDIVIANAGINAGVQTEYYEDLAQFDRTLATNLSAVATCFHAFIAPMRKRGHGTLVAIASVAGVRGLPGDEAYCASKAALISYCESVRVGLRGSGLRVVTIAPGFIRTPMNVGKPYRMPFLMDVDAFARRAADAIERGTSFVVIPWPMAWLARLLRLLPNWAFDRLLARRPRKPRAGPDAGR
ncbi:MAG TPA: SDR family oxidoreductase [Burkholderiaceae bacterium]|nr:SDR family oxidoreductase [Burkholderiaceae bacterium]